MNPDCKQEVFEVEIYDQRGMCFAERAAKGNGWEWELSKLVSSLPSFQFLLGQGSSTMHSLMHVCDVDFVESPGEEILDNDEETLLGRRVILKDLRSRSDLNGSIGRAGAWITEQGRYKVCVPEWESAGPCTIAVRSSNLAYAPPLRYETVKEAPMLNYPTPLVAATWCRPKNDNRCPLDAVLGRKEPAIPGDSVGEYAMDTYNGPLSRMADAILHEVGHKTPNSRNLGLAWIPYNLMKYARENVTAEAKNATEQSIRYEQFVAKLFSKDKPRVKLYETDLRSSRNKSKWDEWLTLKVSIDGLVPPVERVIVVTPNITMNRLHHQVLCPASKSMQTSVFCYSDINYYLNYPGSRFTVGWTPNFHSYAFRRIRYLPLIEQECWVGPRASTALDSFFQPFYIGGAVANDRKVLLGDLFVPDDDGQTELQYVHDFGDWWSHTITITKTSSRPPDETTVAHLESGSGSCPPEDSGGVIRYCDKMEKLSGLKPITSADSYETTMKSDDKRPTFTDPSKEVWWRTWNSEFRGKLNAASLQNPLRFDIDKHRLSLEDSLRCVVVPGTEHEQLTAQGIGRISQTGPDGVQHRRTAKPTDECALCGITAALKLCSGCKGVAFCCRNHQTEYWPKHKKACLAAQKKAKTQKADSTANH